MFKRYYTFSNVLWWYGRLYISCYSFKDMKPSHHLEWVPRWGRGLNTRLSPLEWERSWGYRLCLSHLFAGRVVDKSFLSGYIGFTPSLFPRSAKFRLKHFTAKTTIIISINIEILQNNLFKALFKQTKKKLTNKPILHKLTNICIYMYLFSKLIHKVNPIIFNAIALSRYERVKSLILKKVSVAQLGIERFQFALKGG